MPLRRGRLGRVEWLLEGEWDWGAEQLEGSGLDGGGGGDVLVGEGEFGEGGTQVPGEVAGEHADQHVAADPVGEVVVDGSQVQVVGLGDAEVPFHVLEVLVGGDRPGRVEDVLPDAGADHIDPVQGGLGGDLGLVPAVAEVAGADVEDEVLAHLMLVDHLAGPDPDLVRVLQPPRAHGPADLGQLGLGGGQQLAAGAGPVGGQYRIVAADQPMAGAFSAVIQPIPSSLRRSSMRVPVIIPRSPTMIIVVMPKSRRMRTIAVLHDSGSEVLPGNTSTATGRPCRSVSSPYSTWRRPRLPSRECPKPASAQCEPSTHELDRSNMAIPPSARCRAASCFSTSRCRATSQSIAAYTSSVLALATPRSVPSVVSPACHQRAVDSSDSGRTARETISA